MTPDTLRAQGLVAKRGLVKVLGRGELTKALTVARARLLGRGGAARSRRRAGPPQVLPAPWGDRRPPARGNTHTNR